MGYTHYYYKDEEEHDQETWNSFLKDVKKIVKNLPEHSTSSGGYHSKDPLIIAGWDGEGKPSFTKNMIKFNGGGGFDHETFSIYRVVDEQERERARNLGRKDFFEFCKTARKPYDLLVQAVLILYKHHFGSHVRVSSDGCFGDWVEAYVFVENVMGFTPVFSLE